MEKELILLKTPNNSNRRKYLSAEAVCHFAKEHLNCMKTFQTAGTTFNGKIPESSIIQNSEKLQKKQARFKVLIRHHFKEKNSSLLFKTQKL